MLFIIGGTDLIQLDGLVLKEGRVIDTPYAGLLLVVNWGAGRSEGIITMEDIERVLKTGMTRVFVLLSGFCSG